MTACDTPPLNEHVKEQATWDDPAPHDPFEHISAACLEKYSLKRVKKSDVPDPKHVTQINRLLAEVSAPDREMLTRFFLYSQSEQQICEEMNLTSKHFRTVELRIKSRIASALLRE